MDPVTKPGNGQTMAEKPENTGDAAQAKAPAAAADIKTGDVESDQGRELAPEPTNYTDSTDAPVINYRTLSWW